MIQRVRRMLGRGRLEAEMREEMEFHRAARTADLISRGVIPADAERQARLEFGGVDRYQEECRSALGFRLTDELQADLRYAARGIRQSPGFSAAAVAILALAIGANSVLFTLYSSYMIKPLAIRGVERHFDLEGRTTQLRKSGSWTAAERSTLRDGAANQIEGLYSSDTIQVLMLEPVQRHVLVTAASGNYFALLGGAARTGRTFGEHEERDPVAVLSDSGWRRLMAGDPAAVGKTLRVRSTSYTIVGIAAADFTGVEMVVPDFWVPSGMEQALRDRPASAGEPRMGASAVLRPGVSKSEAEAVLSAVASRFERLPEERVAKVALLRHHSLFPENEDMSAAMAMVFVAFLLVLLIACANLANLYLGRAASRTHEIAIRLSLGASRVRLVRQLLTESTVIALLGAGAGLAIAAMGMRSAQDYLFSSMMGIGLKVLPVSLDWRVAAYTVAMAIAAGMAFGLLPALEATSPNLVSAAKRGAASFAGRIRPRRMRNLLIGGQVAASLVMLILAGVLVRNIQRLDAMEPGYDLDRILSLKADRVSREMLERVARVEGVRAVTAVSRVPLSGRPDQRAAFVNGTATPLFFNSVDERYFEVLGVPVTVGRGFTRYEAESRAKVTVISAATARKLWHATAATLPSVLGKTLELPAEPSEDSRNAGVYQVIGVAPDVMSGWIFEGHDASFVYLPAAAGAPVVDSAIARVEGNVARVSAGIRKACAEGGQTAAGCEPGSLRDAAGLQRFPFQAAAAVAGLLGALALVLTAIGLYGVVSYSVVQRRREIGVHVALGALPRQVMGRILGEAARCVAGGLAVGLPVCAALSKLASSSVLQIRTFDPASYVLVPALLTAIAMLACYGPARRAARMDAMRSLREE